MANQEKDEIRSVRGLVRTDGKVTGYVLSDGLKITREQGEELLQKGMLNFDELMPRIW